MHSSILLVEDDARLAELLTGTLTRHGYAVAVEPRGGSAAERILREQPDLVLLDITLPGEDGLSVCRRVRSSYQGPLLFLTARGDDAHVVAGLNLGADDYLVKPISAAVLVARIQTHLRRRVPAAAQPQRHGRITLDPARRACTLDGEEVSLTQAEFELLSLFVANAGRILEREFLQSRLRAQSYDAGDRSIDLRVSRLRHKLAEAGADAEVIETVRGAGYLFGAE